MRLVSILNSVAQSSMMMKTIRNIVWFEDELDKISQSIKQHNKFHSNCKISLKHLQRESNIFGHLSRIHYQQHLQPKCSSLNALLLISCITTIGILGNYSWINIKWNRNADCLLPLPDSLNNGFVAQQSCNFCSNLTTIDRVEKLSSKEFVAK